MQENISLEDLAKSTFFKKKKFVWNEAMSLESWTIMGEERDYITLI